HVLVRGEGHDPRQRARIFFLYQFVIGLGVLGLITFAGHVFNPVETATRIGWPPSPEFQRELGLFELGFALAAGLGLIFRNRYYWLGLWIAPAVCVSTAGGNAILHGRRGTLAAYNVWTSLPDILIPLTPGWFLWRVFRLESGPARA